MIKKIVLKFGVSTPSFFPPCDFHGRDFLEKEIRNPKLNQQSQGFNSAAFLCVSARTTENDFFLINIKNYGTNKTLHTSINENL
jgi:hypothetical protein